MNASSDVIQAERILRIETPLGADALLAQKLVLREGISELFEARVSVRAKADVAPADLLGKPVDVSLELGRDARRAWNGIVTDLAAGPRQSRGLRSYELVIRPRLWLLGQTSDCRIWMDRTALDVAAELLSEHGMAAPVTAGVVEPPPPQHNSVQWNETDLDYLVRRLEADGLYWWFAHEAGSHRMHLASHASGYTGGEDVRFAAGSSDRNHLSRFETTWRYTPGAHAAGDWNFLTPGTVPGSATPGLVSLAGNAGLERYEYPLQGGYGEGGASEGIADAAVARVSRLRMQAMEAGHARVQGEGAVRTLAPGQRFTPYDVANPDNVFDPHVVAAITHEVYDASYESVTNQPEYQNSFEALPADVPATPEPLTPRPRIDGAQVAIVAGPPGEEIHPDAHGRIRLWFPWDRRAKKDGTDGAWVRVAQSWAGAGWGAQTIPRIGMEVLVSYLDGDPDRPVVTGVVPNARQTVPYALPGNKTKTVLRSQTHKGEGFNELSFEDEAGAENLFLHAQKDMTTKVLNDQSANVQANRVDTIGRNVSTAIGANAVERIGQNKSVTVGGGGAQLLGTLLPLLQAGGKLFQKAGNRSGAAPVSEIAGGMVGGVGLPVEASMLQGILGFAASGAHRQGQGVAQAGAAAALAGRIGSLLGGSGILSTVVERFRTDTIGIARTEQIGIAKNTVVGNIQTTSVGKTKKLVVGKDYDYEAKGSIFGRTVRHTLHAKDKFVIAGPGGSITIDASGITIKASHLKVKSPKVDFLSGSPDQVEALRSDKPFVQECKGKGS